MLIINNSILKSYIFQYRKYPFTSGELIERKIYSIKNNFKIISYKITQKNKKFVLECFTPI